MTVSRCAWAQGDPLMEAYHDKEWGVVAMDDHTHFEFLVLESAQAGLSWKTVLQKRENYRLAFAGFDPVKVAAYTAEDVEKCMHNAGIIRNRAKIESAINNAKRFLEVQLAFGSFTNYAWQFIGNKQIVHQFSTLQEYPTAIPQAETFAKDLKKRGFKFLGPTTIYAHMQATGMVDDHQITCFRRTGIA